VAYLQEYSAGMRLRLGTRVRRIDRTDQGWELVLDRGSLTAAHVVIATGSDAEPFLPDWPGLDSFGGTVIHAGQFRNVAEAAGRDVLVVGPGLWFFGLDSSIYGNMHVRRRQARQLARAITG
jgi:cation diffusion facilitator CzcD-associated flavoprotein CzcO